MKRETLEFMRQHGISMTDGCWIWTKTKIPDGYGQVKRNGKMRRAHRIAYEIENGPIPAGMCVCHSCDVPACINPAHLFLGTQAQNMADMKAKGRHVPMLGERHAKSKLTAEQVAAIRADGRPMSAIAADYGVGQSTIRRVLTGEGWKHLPHVKQRRQRRLTATEAAAIRAAHGTQQQIATTFGVSQGTVSLIKLGRIWTN